MSSPTREFYKQLWMNAEKTGELTLYPERLKQLLSEEFPPVRWIVDGLIPDGGVTILSGNSSTFKTWLFMEMAVKVSTGEPVFGHFTTIQNGVLIIDEESGKRMLQERFKQFGASDDLQISYISRIGYKLKQIYVDAIASTARELHASLIIFDSLVRFNDGDENVSKDMSEMMDCFRQLADAGFSVLIVHHNRKSGAGQSNPAMDMRGSSDILAAIDCHIGVNRNGQSEYVKLTQTKNRYIREIKPFELRFQENSRQFEYLGEGKTAVDKHREMLDEILEVVTAYPGLSKRQFILKAQELSVDGGQKKIGDGLEELVSTGEIIQQPGKQNSFLYRAAVNSDTESAATAQ
jgi:KaiC/GvpD/RAD55 family RecA-like ATPase